MLSSPRMEKFPTFTKDEAESFASKLEEWSKTLTPEEHGLLVLLLGSYGRPIPTGQIEQVVTEDVRNNIGQTAFAAIRRFVDTGLQELAPGAQNWRR
jgi:hypothetical protein